MTEEAAEEILQEAAEAFAIEQTARENQRQGYQVPSWDEIARACDPIGVMVSFQLITISAISYTLKQLSFLFFCHYSGCS